MTGGMIVVLDVGKTLAKVSLWTRDGSLVDRAVRANERVATDAYVALDVQGIEAWLVPTLTQFASRARIDAIVPVGHGAAAAVIRDGQLAFPPMDYEEPIPPADRRSYDEDRDLFGQTGSPSLPDGLNLGAQLAYLERVRPRCFDGDAMILPWPQYWAWRLSGVAASEVTSLGCHTDLWRPSVSEPSALARKRGWAARLAPLAKASDPLGRITEEWAALTGLPRDVQIYCGLHDSNAALLAARGHAEILENESTVLSTGTWFVAMRSPADGTVVEIDIPEERDCLINVDVHGKMIPSSRFMGGREIEILTGVDTRRIDIRPDQPSLVAAVANVVATGARVLPTFAPGFGPFAMHRGRWVDMPVDEAARRAAVSLYAALVADASLALIGARARIIVEGRFAEAEVFVRALATLRPTDRIFTSNAHNDVSYGALRLLEPSLRPDSALVPVEPLGVSLTTYRDLWQRDVERTEQAA